MSQIVDAILRIRRSLSVLLHAGLVATANLFAFWLRFDGDIPEHEMEVALDLLPVLLFVRLLVFIPFRLFEGLWKYTSLWDLRNIVLAVAASTAAFYPIAAFYVGPVYPRSVYIIDSIVLVCLMTAVRLTRRIYRELTRSSAGRRLIIYGAGDAGEAIVRDMFQNEAYGSRPVAFVDDDQQKHGQRIHGVPVLGGREQLAGIIRDTAPDEVLIAIPSASSGTLRAVVRALELYKLPITTLPRLSDLSGQHVGVAKIRRLRVEDLLAREPVTLDRTRVPALIANRIIMVTGAGGSIGAELCRQILEAKPARLVMLDRYENNLFSIHAELSKVAPPGVLMAAIGDITDAERLDRIFAAERPAVVYHAAAHKHVPLMEENPSEAVKNNVRGTRLVAESAMRWKTERVVLISSDKAVNPTSVMGATKRLAERIFQRQTAPAETTFCAVRFGNVLGSNGSVVPTFLDQIKAGGPVTVTHPEMRRYFMLIPEAVQLVLQAAALDGRGSVYVLDMGEQVLVSDMARDVIRLSGYVPDKDIEIVFTGIRPAEKLSEELVGPDEQTEPSQVEKVQRVHSATNASDREFFADLECLERAASQGDDNAVMEALRRMVPSLRRALPWTA